MLKAKYIVIAWLLAMGIFGAFLFVFTQKNDALTQWFNKENFAQMAEIAYTHAEFARVEKLYHEHYTIHQDDIDITINYIDALVLNQSGIKANNFIQSIYPTIEESYRPTLDLYLGVIHFQNKDYEKSIESLKQAAKSTDNDVQIRSEIKLAFAYLKVNEIAKVEEQLHLLTSHPEVIPEIESLEIELSQRSNQFEKLKAHYTRINTLLQSDKPITATSSFKANLVVYRMNVEGRNIHLTNNGDLGQKNFILGNSYLKLGQWDNAMDTFAESALHSSAPANTDFWLGINALTNGDFAEAKIRLNEALTKKNNFPFARQALETIPN
jgi:tetratricopeptide (TPR) repeat protein